MNRQQVDGDNVLYHYLQKDLYENDIWLFQMLSARLVASLGIWFRPTFYQRLPVILPFAVRDPNCRPRRPGMPDEWGSPDAHGYFRDDNSLIKSLPRSLRICSPLTDIYSGRKLGSGFVASHVWRSLSEDAESASFASRNPWTYSFVPNLVWLPAQVSKLTDREGSFTQLYLQALSIKLYRDVPIASRLKRHVDQVWDKLVIPIGIPQQGLPDANDLSFFEDSPRFLDRRRRTILEVRNALQTVTEGQALVSKVVSSRYTRGLERLDHRAALELDTILRAYLEALGDAELSDQPRI